MAVTVTHTTPADGTFSTAGATAWEEAHTLTGLGTGVETALGIAVGSAGSVLVNGGALGTPSSGTLTNATGLPIAGITGLGTGVGTALAVNVGSAGAFVTLNGALGTPSSGTLTNATGLPISTGVSGLGTGVATFLATPSSANLRSALTDETGTGAAVFASMPTFVGTKETVYTISDGAAFEIDPANGGVQIVTLGASRTPAATNFAAGQSVLLGIDDGTAYTITWTTVSPTWLTDSGAAPTLATSGYTWIVLFKVSSTIYAARIA